MSTHTTHTRHITARRPLAMLLAAVAALALCGAPPAQATHAGCELPPIGAEIPMSGLAINTPLTIRTAHVSVDFRGGMKVGVERNPDDPSNSRRLKFMGFKMSAGLPSPDLARSGLSAKQGGAITIEQNDIDAHPQSILRRTQQSPCTFENTLVLTFTMVIDQPERSDEPLVLVTKNPARLIGHLTQFPPNGNLYQLQSPVDLVDVDNPDGTIATIAKFPVKIGGL